jgi:hypothetical protein
MMFKVYFEQSAQAINKSYMVPDCCGTASVLSNARLLAFTVRYRAPWLCTVNSVVLETSLMLRPAGSDLCFK